MEMSGIVSGMSECVSMMMADFGCCLLDQGGWPEPPTHPQTESRRNNNYPSIWPPRFGTTEFMGSSGPNDPSSLVTDHRMDEWSIF